MTPTFRTERGRRAWRSGHRSEWWVALYLMVKGYQILGFRLKTPRAEIDILARKGAFLVAVEVKSRKTPDMAELSLKADQQKRLMEAVTALGRSRPSLNQLQPRLDLIALSPGRFPRHIQGLVMRERELS